MFKIGKRTPSLLEPVHSDVPELRGAELSAVYYGQRVGGDFYDFLRVSGDRVVFGLLDVAGRHEQTREVAVAAQQTFREAAPQLFSDKEVNEADAMIELCLRLNRTILEAANGRVLPCPALAACYNENIGTVCYFNAGHTPGLLRDKKEVSELGATGLPLGLFSHVTCDAPTIGIAPEGALVLISKGLIEATRKTEELGMERAKATLSAASCANAKEICLAMLDGVKRFMGTPPTHNDVTVLTLLRSPSI